jgi:2-isopropylmalate synthase
LVHKSLRMRDANDADTATQVADTTAQVADTATQAADTAAQVARGADASASR